MARLWDAIDSHMDVLHEEGNNFMMIDDAPATTQQQQQQTEKSETKDVATAGAAGAAAASGSQPSKAVTPAKKMKRWWPSIDVKETETEVHIQADLPGVKKEDVQIDLTDGVTPGKDKKLVIKGKKEDRKEEKGDHWHRTERSFGEFSRAFLVPAGTQPASINAQFENGVLTVKFPKPKPAPVAEPQRIDIK